MPGNSTVFHFEHSKNFVNSGNNYGSNNSNISANIDSETNNFSGTPAVHKDSSNDYSLKDNSNNHTNLPQTTKEQNRPSPSLSSKGPNAPAELDDKDLPPHYWGGPYDGPTPPERLQRLCATPHFDYDHSLLQPPLLPDLETDTGKRLAMEGFPDSSQNSSAPLEECPDTTETMVGSLALPSLSE